MFALRKTTVSNDQTALEFISSALEGVSARVMIADNDFKIVYANAAVVDFLRTVEGDIKKDLPGFNASRLVGINIDSFHKNPGHQRQMVGGMTGPYDTSIRVGGHLFNLRAYPVYGRAKERIGTAVEWFDSSVMDNAAQIKAVHKAQAVIEFKLDGTILTANENFLKTLGYTLEEIQGKHHSMFVDPGEVSSLAYREFWQTLARGELQAAQYRRMGKGGREVWIEASYNPIFDMKGQPYKVVKFATDITKQVELMKSIKTLVDENLGSIVRAVQLVAEQASSASSGATQTTANVQAVASAGEELHASVQEISQTMSKSRIEADSAYEKVILADEETRQLSVAAQAMNGIVELIQNIAGQVNLLSLNATIEAARAGEAGKGFAVVATEVKNLAGQASEATNRISGEILGIQKIVGSVVQALGEIKTSIDSLRAFVTGVAGAVEEQSAVAKDMSSNMQSAAMAVNDVSGSLTQIVNAVETVNQSVSETTKAAADLAR